jgi:hypothetical protein
MSARRIQTACIAGVTVITVAANTFFMAGCEGLDYSARAEGTGVQVVGAIIVLAKYRANAQQKAVAEQQARAYFAKAAKPEYQKRRTKVQAEMKEKIAATERAHARKIAELKQAAPAPAAVARLEAEKKVEVAKIIATAAEETGKLDATFQHYGGVPERTVVEMPPDIAPAIPKKAVRALPDPDLARSLFKGDGKIAVQVPMANRPEEKGGKSAVMEYDTFGQRLASEDVFVMNQKVRPGSTVKLDGQAVLVASAP